MSLINLYTLSETEIALILFEQSMKSWKAGSINIYFLKRKDKEKEKVVDKKVSYNLWRSFTCDCCEYVGLSNRWVWLPRLSSLMADGSLSFVFFAPTKLLFKEKKTNLHQPDLVGTNKSELCIILDVCLIG